MSSPKLPPTLRTLLETPPRLRVVPGKRPARAAAARVSNRPRRALLEICHQFRVVDGKTPKIQICELIVAVVGVVATFLGIFYDPPQNDSSTAQLNEDYRPDSNEGTPPSVSVLASGAPSPSAAAPPGDVASVPPGGEIENQESDKLIAISRPWLLSADGCSKKKMCQIMVAVRQGDQPAPAGTQVHIQFQWVDKTEFSSDTFESIRKASDQCMSAGIEGNLDCGTTDSDYQRLLAVLVVNEFDGGQTQEYFRKVSDEGVAVFDLDKATWNSWMANVMDKGHAVLVTASVPDEAPSASALILYQREFEKG